MAYGNVSNYQSAANGNAYEVMEGPEGQKYIRVFNNTGGALANGLVKQLGFLVDYTDTANPIIKAVPVAATTEAVGVVRIIVIDNGPDGKATIPNNEWGWACAEGYCLASVIGDATAIVYGDQLEVLNAATRFIRAAAASSGASGALVDECAAIAMETYTTASVANKKVYLVGWQCVVKGA